MSQKQVDISLTLERPMTAGELVALVIECYVVGEYSGVTVRHDLKNAQNTTPGSLVKGCKVSVKDIEADSSRTVSAAQSKRATRKGKS